MGQIDQNVSMDRGTRIGGLARLLVVPGSGLPQRGPDALVTVRTVRTVRCLLPRAAEMPPSDWLPRSGVRMEHPTALAPKGCRKTRARHREPIATLQAGRPLTRGDRSGDHQRVEPVPLGRREAGLAEQLLDLSPRPGPPSVVSPSE